MPGHSLLEPADLLGSQLSKLNVRYGAICRPGLQREATPRVMMADENDDPALEGETVKSAFHALCWRVCEDVERAVESGVSRS